MKRVSGLILFFIFLFNYSCQRDIPISIEIKRLSSRTAVFQALNVNVTVIASEDGLLIIDTQRSPGVMSEVLKAVQKEFGRNDLLYIINTHGHWDHASGNQLFPDSIIIGQEKCPEYIRQYPANAITNLWSVRDHVRELKEKLDTMQVDSEQWRELRSEISARRLVQNDLETRYVPTPPGKTFQDSMSLNLSDMTVKLFYAGNAHTNNDIIVYVPGEKMVITGDLFTTKSYYGFRINQMTDLGRLIKVIDRIINDEQGVEKVITSHTDMLTGEDLVYIKSSLIEKYSQYKDKNSAAKLLQKLIEEYPQTAALDQYKQQISMPEAGYYLQEEEFSVLGRRLMGEGKIEEALAVFQLTCETFPESALAFDNLGEVYLKSGNINMAIQHYETSLEILPYNRNAEEILKIIRKNNP